MKKPMPKSSKPWIIGALSLFLTAAGTSAYGQEQSPAAAPAVPADGQSQAAPAVPADGQSQAAPAAPQTTAGAAKGRKPFLIGLNIGTFLPSNGKTRDRFGDSWLEIRPTIQRIAPLKMGGGIAPNIDIISRTNGDNRAFLGLLGVEYRRPLIPGGSRRMKEMKERMRALRDDSGGVPGDANSQFGTVDSQDDTGASQPHPMGGFSRPPFMSYFGIDADVAFADLRSDQDDVHSGVREGVAGSVFLGLNFGNRAFIQAGYREMSDVKNFDLSGANLSAGYRFKF